MTRVPGSISGNQAPQTKGGAAASTDAQLQQAQQTSGTTRVGAPGDGVDANAGQAEVQRPDAAVESGRTMSPELIAQLTSLLKDSGDIGDDVADFADAFFEVADTPKDLRLSVDLPESDRANAESLVRDIARVATPDRGVAPSTINLKSTASAFEKNVESMFDRGVKLSSGDINALVQWVLRESYMETTKDLKFFAEKVKFFNLQKKAIREHLAGLNRLNADLAGLGGEGKNVLLSGEVVDAATANAVGGSGAEAEALPDVIAFRSEEERDARFPEQSAAIDAWLYFDKGDLERYLLDGNVGKVDEIVSLVPFMTVDELTRILLAIGGGDMKTHDDLGDVLSRMADAMTLPQLNRVHHTFNFGVGQNRRYGDILGYKRSIRLKEFENETGRSLPQEFNDQAYREIEQAFFDEYATFQIKDGALRRAIQAAVADEQVGGTEAKDIIMSVIQDVSDMGAGGDASPLTEREIEELREFVSSNESLLTDDARAVFAAFDTFLESASLPLEATDISRVVEHLAAAISGSGGAALEPYSAGAESAAPSGPSTAMGRRLHDRLAQLGAAQAPQAPIAVGSPVELQEEHVLSDGLASVARNTFGSAMGALESVDAMVDADAGEGAPENPADEATGPAYVNEDPPLIEAGFDMDPSDGSIDQAFFVDQPPFIRSHPQGAKIQTKAQLETEIKNLEEKLSSVGDDAQLANIDLQNMLQKQQQTVQLMSNISKMLHDTALAIIRKFG